jgi:hypothetical protein
MVGRVDVILDTWPNGRLGQANFRVEQADYGVSGEFTTFSKTISNLPHGWYRPRVVGLELEGRQRRFEREDKPFEIGFRPICPTLGVGPTTSFFGNRVHPVTRRITFHAGIDIGASAGTRVVAVSSGTVTFAGVNGGYGNCIIIDHGNGYSTLYGHLRRIDVTRGQSVTQEQKIGEVGSTGVSTGPHLHFEIMVNGTPINPARYLSRAVGTNRTDNDTTHPGDQTSTGGVTEELLIAFAKAAYDSNLFLASTPINVTVGNGTVHQGWRLIHAIRGGGRNRWHDGFTYLVFERGKDTVIAFRGTNSSYLLDLTDSQTLLITGIHQQHSDVKLEVQDGAIANIIWEDRNIFITGHSLGGNLAVMAYYEILNAPTDRTGFSAKQYANRIVRIETFNAVGVSQSVANNIRRNGNPNIIIHHYYCCDFARQISLHSPIFPPPLGRLPALEFVGASNPPRRLSHICVPLNQAQLNGAVPIPGLNTRSHDMDNFRPLPVTR